MQHCMNVEGEYLRECYELEQLGQKLSEIFPFEQVLDHTHAHAIQLKVKAQSKTWAKETACVLETWRLFLQ